MAIKKFKIPKALGACADLLYSMRAERHVLQRQVDDMKKNEQELKDYIIANLPKSKASGVSGKTANAQVKKTAVPTVADWDKLQKYIKKTGAFDLIQRRLNTKAVEERWNDKKAVPGVESFTKVDVSCTKL